MMRLVWIERSVRWFEVLLGNLIVILFLWWLIVDKPSRWPVLFVAVPVIVVANFIAVRRLIRGRPSTVLMLTYGCGFLCGVVLISAHFEWWEPALLLAPLAFFLRAFKRYKRDSARGQVVEE